MKVAARPLDGFIIRIGLKNVGAALVARAASQRAQLLGRTCFPLYVQKTVGRAFTSPADFVTTKVRQHFPEPVFGMEFIRQSSIPLHFCPIIPLITVSRSL